MADAYTKEVLKYATWTNTKCNSTKCPSTREGEHVEWISVYSVNNNRIHIHWTCCVILLFSFFLKSELFCLLIAGVKVIGAYDDTQEHTYTHTWLLLLWTRDRPVVEISTWQDITLATDRHPSINGIQIRSPSKWRPQTGHRVGLITTRVVVIVGDDISLFVRVSLDLTPSGTAVQTQDFLTLA